MAHWRLQLADVAAFFHNLEWDEALDSDVPACARCLLPFKASQVAPLYRCTDCMGGELNCRDCTRLLHDAYPLHRFQVSTMFYVSPFSGKLLLILDYISRNSCSRARSTALKALAREL